MGPPQPRFTSPLEPVAGEIAAVNVGIPEVAFDEVSHMSPDCHIWLKDAQIQVVDITEAALQTASAIKNMLGIQEDGYHADGVDENDLLVIACARVHGYELVSDEREQLALPQNKRRYKISAVCKQQSVSELDLLQWPRRVRGAISLVCQACDAANGSTARMCGRAAYLDIAPHDSHASEARP